MDSQKTTSLEKQKKGNLYVYKFSPISLPGSRTPEYQPPVTKKIILGSVWSGLRKSSKSKPKPSKEDVADNDKLEWKGNEKLVKESVMGMGIGNGKEGRKSVSNVEGILMSTLGNGRKSVSSLDEGIKGKGFPTLTLLEKEVGKKLVEEGGRKSTSHVENNMAYVGKFVEKSRKSTGTKLESNNYKSMESAMDLLQVKVLVTDMPGFMQLHASQCARKTYDSLEKFSAKHLAFNLKKEFDKVYGPAWHCIVGSSFGSFVTHATGCFLYFSMEKLCILLFRTKVQRALQQ